MESDNDAGYRISFTSGEALATLAGLRALHDVLAAAAAGMDDDAASAADFVLDPGILDSAAERLAGELPEFARDRAHRLGDALRQSLYRIVARPARFGDTLDVDDINGNEAEERTLPPFPIGRTRRLLEDALEQDRPVEIEYFVTSRNEWTTRTVDVGDVYAANDVWYLSGQCGLRNDYRQFRLDHIRAVRILDDEDGGRDPDLFDDEPGGEKGSGGQSGAFDQRGHRAGRQRRRQRR